MFLQSKRFIGFVRRTLAMINDPNSSTDDCLDRSRAILEWILESAENEND